VVADVGPLYRALAPRLEQIVRRNVRAPTAVIEDACQFAWYRLVLHAHRVEQDTALAWLATTAVHQAVKLTRRDQRELSLDEQVDRHGELNVAAHAPGPHERAELRERLELLRHLPARQQRFLWLKTIGLSYDEIAASQRGLTRRTVERQIYRGRRRLRAQANVSAWG
jgi:RNA polymerase sigma factor (sigma-70 family)